MHKLPPMLAPSQAHGSAAASHVLFRADTARVLSSFMHLVHESARANEEKVAYLYAGHHDTSLIEDVPADCACPHGRLGASMRRERRFEGLHDGELLLLSAEAQRPIMSHLRPAPRLPLRLPSIFDKRQHLCPSVIDQYLTAVSAYH